LREILSTTNLSLVESLLIALEAEGIEAHTEPGLSARRQRRAIHLLVLALVGVIALLCAEALARLHRRSA